MPVLLSDDLAPLVHLDFALEAVTIVRHDTEVVVDDFSVVRCHARHVDERILVGVVGIVSLNIFDGFAAFAHALSKRDHFLLVLPEQDQRKGDQNAADKEFADTQIVVLAG